jgi:hypothetical protein
MKIVGAVYEIETGRVRFLPPDKPRPHLSTKRARLI